MSINQKYARVTIAVLFVLFFAVPFVGAQEPDATQEPEAITVEVSEDEPVTIGTPQAPIVVETQSDLNWMLVWVGAVSTLLLGGLGITLFTRINQNKQLKDSTEALLANSVPASALDKAHAISEAMLAQTDNAMGVIKNLLEFARDVTDRQPNTQPPAQG